MKSLFKLGLLYTIVLLLKYIAILGIVYITVKYCIRRIRRSWILRRVKNGIIRTSKKLTNKVKVLICNNEVVNDLRIYVNKISNVCMYIIKL